MSLTGNPRVTRPLAVAVEMPLAGAYFGLVMYLLLYRRYVRDAVRHPPACWRWTGRRGWGHGRGMFDPQDFYKS